MEKTNVMRILDQKKIPYIPHTYDPSLVDGISVALQLGERTERVFKTLVTAANTGNYYVFVIPVDKSLDLKKAAKAVGVKSVAMIRQKELLPLTGYIHGGCSPVGMKKLFRTVIDETAALFDAIFVSAGKVGFQVALDPKLLAGLTGAEFADLTEPEPAGAAI
ncbi:Cys-tRNA(Pro)/Cys-tRNA(Cys) deacylase [Sporobacter termitidis DSM 10068]|uniref:Cys-tRNA(Pro)/Cys-tRNA(Cys) deacylase n=1 Tax=Sporobacter termitidis DSM 10068 TaxID=1123282 RepID=A0A1M5YX71_9FIRM|nr:Cys-tRNA(Pro) deacylase [Sporobacter termitidis]SHI16627.1 Cys-tRNA(Pro)/Cys-tRNA(Cys) deacylase [Sporobacter termitidis DSM 10068]